MEYVIYFKSKVEESNTGFSLRNRNEGFASVPNAGSARRYITRSEARNIKAQLEAKEGEFYDFEIQEVEI